MEYKINKLYLKNFKFIKDNEIKKIEFGKENLVILGGPNGYGKTTIFDALEIIFKNKIEGIKKITKSRRYLKDSLLLNNGDRSGILGIELVNFNKTISIITKISSIQGHPELDILVQKFYKEENLKIEDIQNFKLKEYKEIKNISEIKGLENFQEKNYNLFNYISQKNYCYYLEKDEEERNQIITELLGLSEIKDYQKYLDDIVSKKSINLSLLKKIEKKEEEIKELIFENNINMTSMIKNLNQTIDENKLKILDFSKFEEVNNVKNLKELKTKYEIELENYKFLLLNNSKYCNYKKKKKYENQLGIFNKISNILLPDILEENIFLKSYHINDAYIEKEKKKNEKLKKLKKLISEKLTLEKILDIEDEDIKIERVEVGILKESISIAEKKLDNNKKIMLELKKYREELFKLHKNEEVKKIIKENECPYCGSKLKNLELMYKEILNRIDENNSYEGLDDLYKKREECLEINYTKILEKIKELEENEKNITKIEKIEKNRVEINSFFEFCKNEKIEVSYFELNEILVKKIKEISDDSFEEKIEKILENHILDEKKIKEMNLDNMLEIEKYLEFKFIEIWNLLKAKNQDIIRKNVIELIKMEKLYKKIEKISEIYIKRKKELEDGVIPKLEIPLYIYTGKVLQDYQRGMGVFIKKASKGIKFVPEAGSDQDLVNSFSSGQLSGFVVVLMLVMNKLFKERENGLDTLLVDDPFHTLDDVNMTSLIEILRRTFYRNQIILSSHEDKKIGYILYKYSKFNLKAKELDVKNEFFNI